LGGNKYIPFLFFDQKHLLRRFQDGGWREEAESVLPKVKPWRDTGDTHYRKNDLEEAKL
jgi:hypothetical protein